ncbi:MAG TPA: DUF1802 family protein [Chthoniobacterales bacterium]|jgi:hypothetical protein|nr:DUF1802 family protein [Chthoniobacterales bacterium]
MGSVGFKEWALVCEALGRGEQTILLRKGGLAEGRQGFRFRHSEFFLFPTFFHEQVGKVRRSPTAIPPGRDGEIEIRSFAKLEAQRKITAWEEAAALEPLHILAESVVRERFEYKGAGLHAALVRVFRLEPSWISADKPAYGGCRSWVDLPAFPAGIRFDPVLGDQEHGNLVRRFHASAPS